MYIYCVSPSFPSCPTFEALTFPYLSNQSHAKIESTIKKNTFFCAKGEPVSGLIESFLAAKRSSTRALVPLSVCLSLVKPEFLIVWSAYDNL